MINRGNVFYADLGERSGSEQGGIRPVVILQNDTGNRYSPTVIIASITGKINKAKLPTHVEINKNKEYKNLDKSSIVLLEQIRTLDKKKLKEFRCTINKNDLKKIDRALKISLSL